MGKGSCAFQEASKQVLESSGLSSHDLSDSAGPKE